MKKPSKPNSLMKKPVKSTSKILEIQSKILNDEESFTVDDLVNEMIAIKNEHPTFDNQIYVQEDWDCRLFFYKIVVITENSKFEEELAKYEKDLSDYNAKMIKYHEYQLKKLS